MIIFGYRGRWSRRRDQTGEFFCPQCGGDRQWVLAVLRRWFTLFFVPLFPVSKASVEAVECTTCHSRFHTEVLGQPTVSGLTAELQGAMRLAATAVVRSAGGLPNPVAVDAVRHQGLDSYDASALAHDVAQLDLASLPEHLTYLAGAVSLTGREQLLGTLADVARTGSGGAARATLEQIGRGLGLSPAHVAGVLHGLEESRAADAPPAGGDAWQPPSGPAAHS